MTLSRHHPGGFDVTPAVMVDGLGAPVPHPTEVIWTILISTLFVTLVIPVVRTSCTCTEIYSAEAFAQQFSALKSKGCRGHREGACKRCTIGSPVGSLSVGDAGHPGCGAV